MKSLSPAETVAAAGKPGEERASDVPEAELDTHLAGSYGIFSGPPKAWATIAFSARAARWVADEHWHSRQEGRFLGDGRYELRVPYSNARELLMDVMRYGPDAEVVAPAPLRECWRVGCRGVALGEQHAHDLAPGVDERAAAHAGCCCAAQGRPLVGTGHGQEDGLESRAHRRAVQGGTRIAGGDELRAGQGRCRREPGIG